MTGPARAAATEPRWLRACLFALPVALAGVLAVFPLHNDDAGFHIATGRYVLATGAVPTHNPFGYAPDGATWIQHQWLPATGMAWLVDHGGVAALVLAKATLVVFAFGIAAFSALRAGTPAGLGCLLLTTGVAAAAFRFYERPYLSSILALTTTVAALLAWQAGSRRARNLAIAVPVLAVHLHAGGLDSVLAWCAFAGGHGLARLLARRQPAGPDGAAPTFRQIAGALLLMLTLLAGTLAVLAPSGLAVLLLPFSFSADPWWHAHLAEFRPLAFDREALPQWLALGVTAAGAVLATARRRWFEALLLAGFAVLALRHVRMVWPMVAAGLPVLVDLAATPAWRPRLQQPAARVLALGLAAAIGLWATVEQDARFGLGLGPDGVAHERHPLNLLRRAAALPGEAFVSDGLAGTWLWQAYQPPRHGAAVGQHRVLVHNCLECYDAATYRDIYQRIRYAEPGWQDLVARYGIRTFVLKHTTAGERRFQGGRPNVRQHLFASADWVLVDFDDAASVYTLRATLPPGTQILADFPLDPDTGRPRPGAQDAAIHRALQAHAAGHRDGVRSLDMLARAHLRRGELAAAAETIAEMARRRPRAPAVAELLERLRTQVPRAPLS